MLSMSNIVNWEMEKSENHAMIKIKYSAGLNPDVATIYLWKVDTDTYIGFHVYKNCMREIALCHRKGNVPLVPKVHVMPIKLLPPKDGKKVNGMWVQESSVSDAYLEKFEGGEPC